MAFESFTIIWLLTASINGSIVSNISPDKIRFDTLDECVDYGKEMRIRAFDWARGFYHLEFTDPVKVTFVCKSNGFII